MENSSDKSVKHAKKSAAKRTDWKRVAAIVAWTVTAYFCTQLLLGLILYILRWTGVFVYIGTTVETAALGVMIYVAVLAVLAGVPWLVRRYRTTWREIGVIRWPTWTDIALSLLGVVVYFILALTLVSLAANIIPNFNLTQAQDTGFASQLYGYDLLIVFVLFVVVAPLAEEMIFRGWLYGKLRGYQLSAWATALLVSGLFGLAHGQWNVGVDTFALSLVLCVLRERTESIWAGVLVHMFKNGLAFYFLYVASSQLLR